VSHWVTSREEIFDRAREIIPACPIRGEVKDNHGLVIAQDNKTTLRAVLTRLLRDQACIVYQGSLHTWSNGINDLLCRALWRDKCIMSPVIIPQRVPFFQAEKCKVSRKQINNVTYVLLYSRIKTVLLLTTNLMSGLDKPVVDCPTHWNWLTGMWRWGKRPFSIMRLTSWTR